MKNWRLEMIIPSIQTFTAVDKLKNEQCNYVSSQISPKTQFKNNKKNTYIPKHHENTIQTHIWKQKYMHP